jgi:uncharacterized repeat protein (TIGR04138 family)
LNLPRAEGKRLFPRQLKLDVPCSCGYNRSRQHVTSVELCFGLREYALVLFDEDADEARAALKDWNIRSSEDVGKIIFAMIKSGFILPSEGDNLKDFDSIFSLDTLFTSDNCT